MTFYVCTNTYLSDKWACLRTYSAISTASANLTLTSTHSLTPIPSPNGKASPNPSERRGEPNGSKLRKGILKTKRALLQCEGTPFSLQGNALFTCKGDSFR